MYRAANGGKYGACLHTAVLIAVISYVVLAGFGGPIGPRIANADTPVIGNTSAVAPAPDVYGYVYDSKGNKVPHAHVTIYYLNGTVMWIQDNPKLSGIDNDQGYYGFSGVDIGNYTIKAEIVNSFGDVYNGTARAFKFDDRPVIANVTISGYTYSPWISPTPTPLPVAVQMPVSATAKPTATPVPKNNPMSIFNPLYALAASPVIVVGALLFIRNKKPPATKSGRQHIDIARSQTFSSYSGMSVGSNTVSGFSEYFLVNDGYSSELEELVQSKVKNHYNDIAVIHRVEKISQKYGIELTIVYRDMKRIKTSIERGKYL